MINTIKKIAITQTYLNKNEIEKIIEVSKSLDLMANFYEADVFIDVLSKCDDEAIVVAHGRPKEKSLYCENVIGKKALIENEPGVIKCLNTGERARDIKALTQEYKLVKQNIQPITLDDKILAVLIVEKDISSEVKNEFDTNEDEENKNSHQFIKLIENNDFLVDNLNSAILIFDKNGKLKIKNRIATDMYKSIGFECDIQDMHYNDLYIEHTVFEDILIDENYDETNEVSIGNMFFKIKTIYIKDDEFKVCKIVQDISDLKRKEEELILKTVAIRETHHRVKNNLHTVISIIKKQSRLSQNEEVKQCLDNITNRVFAILSTHYLLSKEIDNNISILEGINLLVSNIQGGYLFNKDIDICITGEDFKISGEKATAILLVINEVLQNCYDHAFKNRERGNIQILVNKDNGLRNIAIIDDGIGFDSDNINKNSLGTYIIDSYITQMLKGSIKRKSSKNGTEVLITIPT
ncbi:histidine kinase N-terminal domain-containing protein [Clostridioides sp. ZZV15-6388]|uniref:histidine kinase N-terminal domain-containing protein n=1 Tax=Clostridioides sp. ZZV15-6388 TaxID=2811499 RepID=UPI001D0FB474|nr:histidine kinase N-terminal domain-containing protein [Clostridioides sp. ZZV15-6388]